MKRPFGKKKSTEANEPSSQEEQSFFGKVKHFFSTEPQKEKVLRHEDFNAAGDVYYAHVSAAYKVAQRILWLVFVVFMVFSVLTNYREITYDNFFYLIKDFSGAVDSDGSRYETLSYESDSRQNFALYRGGGATVSPSRMSVFTSTGRRTLNTTVSYSSPYMVSSNRYILVYDTSGTTFALYNSFAKIHTETLDYPVTDACLAEDGSFAIVTRSADSRSVIILYDRDFEREIEIRADYHVFDIALDRDRNLLSVLSFDAGDGTGRTTLSVWDLNEKQREENFEDKLSETQWDGEFPLACGFLEGRQFAVLTNRHVRILDDAFAQEEISDDYFGGNITGYSLNEQGAAVAVPVASQNRIFAFDKSGDLLYNGTVEFNVSDIGVYDSYLFLQTEDGITRLDTQRETTEHLTSGDGVMMIYNDRTAMVCGESKAEYLMFARR